MRMVPGIFFFFLSMMMVLFKFNLTFLNFLREVQIQSKVYLYGFFFTPLNDDNDGYDMEDPYYFFFYSSSFFFFLLFYFKKF